MNGYPDFSVSLAAQTTRDQRRVGIAASSQTKMSVLDELRMSLMADIVERVRERYLAHATLK